MFNYYRYLPLKRFAILPGGIYGGDVPASGKQVLKLPETSQGNIYFNKSVLKSG